MRLHAEDGSECTPETCGGVSYDPCSYSDADARAWCKSVYIVGGAGAGKSTFMAALIDEMGIYWNTQMTDLLSLQNAKALVTLRGHEARDSSGRRGMYLGCLREHFPGTDGLDRASSPVGEKWLNDNRSNLPDFIVSEGATLATRRFIGALAYRTDMLLVHLTVDEEMRTARFAERGSNQNPRFVANTVTRSRNIAAFAAEAGAKVIGFNTADRDSWDVVLGLVADHLEK